MLKSKLSKFTFYIAPNNGTTSKEDQDLGQDQPNQRLRVVVDVTR